MEKLQKKSKESLAEDDKEPLDALVIKLVVA